MQPLVLSRTNIGGSHSSEPETEAGQTSSSSTLSRIKRAKPAPSSQHRSTTPHVTSLIRIGDPVIDLTFSFLHLKEIRKVKGVCWTFRAIVDMNSQSIQKCIYAYFNMRPISLNGVPVKDVQSQIGILNRTLEAQVPLGYPLPKISSDSIKRAIDIENVFITLTPLPSPSSLISKLLSVSKHALPIMEILKLGVQISKEDLKNCIAYGNAEQFEQLLTSYQKQLSEAKLPTSFEFELGDVLGMITNPSSVNIKVNPYEMTYSEYDDAMGEKIKCIYKLMELGALFHPNALAYLWRQSHFNKIHATLTETIILELPNAVNEEAIITLIGVEGVPTPYFREVLGHFEKPSSDKANEFVLRCVQRHSDNYLVNLDKYLMHLEILINSLVFAPGSKKLDPFYSIPSFIEEDRTHMLLEKKGWI